MIGRIAMALLALTLALIAGAYLGDWRLDLSQGQAELLGWRQSLSDEEAMRRDVQWHASSSTISEKIGAALARNDVDDAAMYSELANWAEITIGADVASRVATAQTEASAATPELSRYAKGYVFSAPTSFTALAGVFTADTTVVGDVRDIASEGAKLRSGDTFDDVILGLSVVGIAATTKSVPTEGGGAVIKSGAALLKFAQRVRTLTDQFTVRLKQIIANAVNFKELEVTLKDVDLSDLTKTQKSLVAFSETVEPAPLFPIVASMDAMCTASGVGECMRLMALAQAPEDLGELVGIAKVAGRHARGVIELTGITQASDFKGSVNILQFLGENIASVVIWIAILLILILWRWFLPAREPQYQRAPVRTRSKRRR
jgi:hypothetical protein